MTIPAIKGKIPVAPAVYNSDDFNRIFKTIDKALEAINNPGPIRATRVSITDLPTSATGLKAGDLWNDSGTVKVV